MNYDEYMQSDEWRERANQAIERAGNSCQLCNSQDNLHVHHRTYERLGWEKDMDLTVLCEDCHNHFHDFDPVKKNEELERRVFYILYEADPIIFDHAQTY